MTVRRADLQEGVEEVPQVQRGPQGGDHHGRGASRVGVRGRRRGEAVAPRRLAVVLGLVGLVLQGRRAGGRAAGQPAHGAAGRGWRRRAAQGQAAASAGHAPVAPVAARAAAAAPACARTAAGLCVCAHGSGF